MKYKQIRWSDATNPILKEQIIGIYEEEILLKSAYSLVYESIRILNFAVLKLGDQMHFLPEPINYKMQRNYTLYYYRNRIVTDYKTRPEDHPVMIVLKRISELKEPNAIQFMKEE